MEQMKPHPDNVLIFISELERRKLFEKPIATTSGDVLWLVTGIKEEKNQELSYSQGLTIGLVMAVGDRVGGIEVGDHAIIDYVVDLSDDNIVQADEMGKLVSIPALTTFHNSDLVIDANRRTPHPTVVNRKGDIDEVSMLIAVVRKGEIIPNNHYILFEHKKRSDDWETRDNMVVLSVEQERTSVERTVLAVSADSIFKVGDKVMVEEEALFDREAEGVTVDVAFEQDVLLKLTN